MFSYLRDEYKITFTIEERVRQEKKPLKRAIKRAIEQTLDSVPLKVLKNRLVRPSPYALTVTIIDKKEMEFLNHSYRKKKRPTDVLSFSRLEGIPMPFPEIGDVVLCLSVAEKQAKTYGVPLEAEIQRLTVHGILHLFGFDHEKNEQEAKRMFSLQDRIVQALRLRA